MEYFKEVGRRLSNWARWGKDDRRGTLNFITPAKIAIAGRLIETGKIFSLGKPLGGDGCALAAHGARSNFAHFMSLMPGDLQLKDGAGFADDFMIMPLQSGTQWDGLAHCFYDGLMYNGCPTSAITASRGALELGIEQLVPGVAGRGILLDIARLKRVESLPAGFVISPRDLDEAEERQGVRASSGDILLVRTGWGRKAPSGLRARLPSSQAVDTDPTRLSVFPEPGLSQACCEWLHAREIAAVASDNYAIEVIPVEDSRATLPVHCILIRDMGMTLGELFDLEDLARDCNSDGVWAFFFIASPLNIANGLGSPINPLALK